MTKTDKLGDNPQRGLGPTRARVLQLLQDAGLAMTAPELGERMGLHANTARFHLDALTAEGLVTRASEERRTPGRPKVIYAAAGAAPAVSHRSYRLLAEILTSYLSDRLPDPAGSAEEAGEAWGRLLAAPAEPTDDGSVTSALQTMIEGMERVGFESHAVEEADEVRVEVSHCPFLEVAEGHSDVVCSVHLGLMRGMLGQQSAPLRAERLEPLVEPSRCIAHLSRV
jgi:predicted ArsR family transcriptional regulator